MSHWLRTCWLETPYWNQDFIDNTFLPFEGAQIQPIPLSKSRLRTLLYGCTMSVVIIL